LKQDGGIFLLQSTSSSNELSGITTISGAGIGLSTRTDSSGAVVALYGKGLNLTVDYTNGLISGIRGNGLNLIVERDGSNIVTKVHGNGISLLPTFNGTVLSSLDGSGLHLTFA